MVEWATRIRCQQKKLMSPRRVLPQNPGTCGAQACVRQALGLPSALSAVFRTLEVTGLIPGDWPRVGASGSTSEEEPGTGTVEKRQILPSLMVLLWKLTVKPHSSGGYKALRRGLGRQPHAKYQRHPRCSLGVERQTQ